MEKNKNRLISFLIILIFVGLLSLSILSYKDSSGIIKSDISNITKLVSANVYSEIQNEFTKPIFVSLTMANDSFLKDWVLNQNEKDIDRMTQYLRGIKEKYGYDSTFFVSNITNNYYYFDGVLKQVSPEDEHDVWFYNFLDKEIEYDLDVDSDQAAEGDLTLFVNCLTTDGENVLGVTGVGLRMSKIREIIHQYQNDFDAQVYLINNEGLITIHSDESLIFKTNAFDEPALGALKNEILVNKDTLELFEPSISTQNEYIASYYINELNWYLIVRKDTDILQNLLITHRIKTVIMYLTAFFLIALLIVYIASHYHKMNLKLVKTDYLTDISNRQAFDDALKNSINHAKAFDKHLTLVVIDIDEFKKINDTLGHLKGDEVLKDVASHLNSFIRSNDLLARWGGDEFTIIFSCDADTTINVLKRISDKKNDNSLLRKYDITLSMGVSQYIIGDTAKSLIARADEALYSAKIQGKDRICIK
jgi:diguanylate cyclase (GGDEF)-like protein